jgi:hypothetical protein
VSNLGWTLLVLGLLYLVPLFIAIARRHPQQNAIGALNFFLGWTFIGWVLSLVWALTNTGKKSG